MTARTGQPRVTPRYLTPVGIALLYAVVGATWILLSDRALELLLPPSSGAGLVKWQTVKGLAYVGVTAILLYRLVQAGMTAIRLRERPYRQMFDSTTVALLVDPASGRIVDANDAASEFYGWTRAQLIGRPIGDLNTLPAAELAVNLDRAVNSERNHFLFQHRTAAGDLRDVEVFSCRVDVGGHRLLYSVVFDLTSRIEAERALAESEARYRSLITQASDAIFIMGPDLRSLEVNERACELTGYTAAELKHLPITALFPPEELVAVPVRVAELQAGRPVMQDRRFVRKDGSVAYAEISSRMLADGRIQAIARDVSERRRLEEQLRQAQKMEAIGQLTGGIAHDLNNVLTIVLANGELLRHGLPPDRADLHSDLSDLQASARRGASMIRKLLSFSRRTPLEVVDLDLSETVAETAATLRRLLPKNIEVTVRVPPAPVIVRADPGALEQILINLATNARDAMPEGGSMRIAIAERVGAPDDPGDTGRYGCVIVHDDGTGMDPDTQARIFEPFFTTKPAPLGTGLGMTMIYGLVKQQGGWIQIRSAPREGTAVRVAFPLGTAATDANAGKAPLESVALPSGSETIMVVEDEAPLRRAAMRLLERLGYAVIPAEDGQEAIELFAARGGDVALVLSDIVMPRMGGRALYDALRAGGHAVRFLFSSGYDSDEVMELGTGAPLPALIHKPWSIAELALKVREVLDS